MDRRQFREDGATTRSVQDRVTSQELEDKKCKGRYIYSQSIRIRSLRHARFKGNVSTAWPINRVASMRAHRLRSLAYVSLYVFHILNQTTQNKAGRQPCVPLSSTYRISSSMYRFWIFSTSSFDGLSSLGTCIGRPTSWAGHFASQNAATKAMIAFGDLQLTNGHNRVSEGQDADVV